LKSDVSTAFKILKKHFKYFYMPKMEQILDFVDFVPLFYLFSAFYIPKMEQILDFVDFVPLFYLFSAFLHPKNGTNFGFR